jgi:hypothetical protein
MSWCACREALVDALVVHFRGEIRSGSITQSAADQHDVILTMPAGLRPTVRHV